MAEPTAYTLLRTDRFVSRHIGPRRDDIQAMVHELGYDTLDAFIDAVVPADIRLPQPLDLPPSRSEREVLQALRGLAAQNRIFRSYLGMGYYGTFTPQVIQRNILENPGWYTAYTPYQAEIAQGRLEALLNFQTLVADLTGLPVANASLLDEATAAAEAMHLTEAVASPKGKPVYLVDSACHPQTIAVVQTRAGVRGVEVRVARSGDLRVRRLSHRRAGPVSRHRRSDSGFPRAVRPGSCRGCSGYRRDGPARADDVDSAWRVGSRHRRRQLAALRGADGLRRSSRRLLLDS